MAMTRGEKEEEISFIMDSLSTTPLAVCADYRGLNVDQVNALRAQLRETGAFGRVVKNTLARISVERLFAQENEEQAKMFGETFIGPSMVVFAGEDPISSAKAMVKFAKEIEHFEIKGGWFDGAYCEKEAIIALSNMPSREELLAKLLNLMNAPATQLLRLANAPASQTVQVLAAYRDKLESQGASE